MKIFLVKFDKSVDSVALTDKQADDEDEQSENISITTASTTTDAGTKPHDPNAAKKSKQAVKKISSKNYFF